MEVSFQHAHWCLAILELINLASSGSACPMQADASAQSAASRHDFTIHYIVEGTVLIDDLLCAGIMMPSAVRPCTKLLYNTCSRCIAG